LLGDPGSKFLYGKLGRQKERKRSKEKKRISKQPSLTAEIR
jgi:hypothetical protein